MGLLDTIKKMLGGGVDENDKEAINETVEVMGEDVVSEEAANDDVRATEEVVVEETSEETGVDSSEEENKM